MLNSIYLKLMNIWNSSLEFQFGIPNVFFRNKTCCYDFYISEKKRQCNYASFKWDSQILGKACTPFVIRNTIT